MCRYFKCVHIENDPFLGKMLYYFTLKMNFEIPSFNITVKVQAKFRSNWFEYLQMNIKHTIHEPYTCTFN